MRISTEISATLINWFNYEVYSQLNFCELINAFSASIDVRNASAFLLDTNH